MLQAAGNVYNFCEIGLRISGLVPIPTEAAIFISNKLVTSVTIATTERTTVAFLGTSDGVLKKVSYGGRCRRFNTINFRLARILFKPFSYSILAGTAC